MSSPVASPWLWPWRTTKSYRLLAACLVARHHEYPTALVTVDDRVRRGLAQPVQLPRRQLQVTATAGATHEVCRSDAAQLGPETLVGGRKLGRDAGGQLIPGRVPHRSFVVDRGPCHAELLASKSQLLGPRG